MQEFFSSRRKSPDLPQPFILDTQTSLSDNDSDDHLLPWVKNPFRLWSLEDMLKFAASEYIEMGETINDIGICLHIGELDKEMVLTDQEKIDFIKLLNKLKTHCDNMHLKIASTLLKDALDIPPSNSETLEILIKAVKVEMSQHLFFFVPSHRAKYYERSDFNERFISFFPKALRELQHAGNSFTVGEYTASVFHSMRAAEIGLRALAQHLNVIFPFEINLAEWNALIKEIEKKIETQQQLPRSTARDEELKFCSEAASQFRHFKNGYRIFVAHARESYDEEPALSIMERTKEFLEGLSIKLSE
ncbi:MAG: HEPN domain-containing protein [Thermodesulfobacteriota bacterium]|jgi:HEPN domain-containing protein